MSKETHNENTTPSTIRNMKTNRTALQNKDYQDCGGSLLVRVYLSMHCCVQIWYLHTNLIVACRNACNCVCVCMCVLSDEMHVQTNMYIHVHIYMCECASSDRPSARGTAFARPCLCIIRFWNLICNPISILATFRVDAIWETTNGVNPHRAPSSEAVMNLDEQRKNIHSEPCQPLWQAITTLTSTQSSGQAATDEELRKDTHRERERPHSYLSVSILRTMAEKSGSPSNTLMVRVNVSETASTVPMLP